ncbi:MAG: pyridoxal-phosphate dependent enzyme [Desulfobacterales bacterium]|nr:pyridoxal-phosphate dependent enzyme [Desulfobacterales bacterium]
MRRETLHFQTPVMEHPVLSKESGKQVLMKMECFQPVGSFKIRGVGYLCRELVAGGAARFISSSGGNAGYAVAYAGRQLGVDVTVVVPETTAPEVRRSIEEQGAEVIVHGSVWDETHRYAMTLASEDASGYIPPFDHPSLWKGHATIIDELARQCEKPDAVVLSVGGGGLLCGVLEGLHRNDWRDVPVIAVETEGAASFHQSVVKGELATLAGITSIATSLGAKQVTPKALEWTKHHEIHSLTVTDGEAVNACLRFADDQRVLVEPACGASLSVVYNQPKIIASARTILVIVCGGIGATLSKLNHWKSGKR